MRVITMLLAASTAPWKIVYMHHPPYSSSQHGSTPGMQWPFENWGASLVLTGHDHTYERILRDDNNVTVTNHAHSTGVVFDGTWHHFAWTDDSGQVVLYIDGQPDATNFSYVRTIALTPDITTLGGILRPMRLTADPPVNLAEPFRWIRYPRQHLQQRAFSCPVAPNDAEHLAALDLEIEFVEHGQVAEALDDAIDLEV